MFCPFWTSYIKTVEACAAADLATTWLENGGGTFPEVEEAHIDGSYIDDIGTVWADIGDFTPGPYAGPATEGWVVNQLVGGPYEFDMVYVVVDAGPGALFIDWAIDDVSGNGTMNFEKLISRDNKTVLRFDLNQSGLTPFTWYVQTCTFTPSVGGENGAPLTLHIKYRIVSL